MALKDRITGPKTTSGTPATPPQAFRRPNGRASFPHRMTLDLDTSQYEWLRQQAYESRIPAAGLLRTVITLLIENPSLLDQATERALIDHPPPS